MIYPYTLANEELIFKISTVTIVPVLCSFERQELYNEPLNV